MKKCHLLFISILFLLPIVLFQIVMAQDIETCLSETLEVAAKKIRVRNPDITMKVLQADIDFLKNNFQNTALAKTNPPIYVLVNVTIYAWIDIRVKNVIPPNVPFSLASLTFINKYGILRVNTEPKQGATVILNSKEVWDKKTNTYRGVASGEHLVEVNLTGHKSDPRSRKVRVPPGGDVTTKFKLKKR